MDVKIEMAYRVSRSIVMWFSQMERMDKTYPIKRNMNGNVNLRAPIGRLRFNLMRYGDCFE